MTEEKSISMMVKLVIKFSKVKGLYKKYYLYGLVKIHYRLMKTHKNNT